jgi:prepilin-type N-terminal cleavage/methylation domain-containing protein/prepilin-type processing-associated H-X9-DG protein
MKKAFTLVEMLVVLGILGVLLAIIISNFSGATESANAAKCMSNMRSLVNAANAIGMDCGSYPMAGKCFRKSYAENGESILTPLPGWISFDRSGNPVPCYGTGNIEDDRYALMNGTQGKFWRATGANAEVYCCPSFTKNFIKKRGKKPLFTYAMSAGGGQVSFGFGANKTVDMQAVSYGGEGIVNYGSYNRADRMVMFAELPIVESCKYDPLANPDTCDGALQINKKIGRYQYGNWTGRSEAIGFVHQDSRKRYFGHVAFADGHVERMVVPLKKGLQEDILTAHVCAGDDCAMDAKNGYVLVANITEENKDSEE